MADWNRTEGAGLPLTRMASQDLQFIDRIFKDKSEILFQTTGKAMLSHFYIQGGWENQGER